MTTTDLRQHQQRIRERAYLLWEQAGRPHGQALDHWSRAERDLATAQAPPPVQATPAPRKRRAAPAADAVQGPAKRARSGVRAPVAPPPQA